MKKICILLLTLASLPAFGQENKPVDISEFIESLQKTRDVGDTTKMVFWFPTEFWDVVNRNSPDYDSNAVKLLEAMVEDYVIIAAVDGTFEQGGGGFKSDAEMRKTLRLIDQNNKVYTPVPEVKVSKALVQLIASIKPMLSSMLGDLGQAFNFYYFQVKDADDNVLIQAKQKGAFAVRLNNSEFQWSLPLPFFLPARYCPVDHVKMKAEWVYCPFHGSKLDR